MTLCSIGGVRIKLHWSILLLALCSVFLSSARPLLIALGLVALHEAAHALAARSCHEGVEEIELAPFGGVARMEALVGATPGREAFIALAGPLMNFLLAMGAAAVVYAFPQAAPAAAQFISLNLTLCFFNLLPGLPLDGGRALRALLWKGVGLRRATWVSGILGALLGVLLAGLGAACYFLLGRFNITMFITGAYLCYAAIRELRSSQLAAAQTLLRQSARLERGRALPIRQIAVRQDAPASEVARQFMPGYLNHVVYLDERLRPQRDAWEGEVLDEWLDGRLSALRQTEE